MTRSQRLRDVFLISLTALVCLTGGIMTWLDGHVLPVGLTIPIAIAAYVFCEHLRWIRLGDLGSNILGIIALIAAATEFLGQGQEAKLLSGAHLLCYVQWIILFQDKEDSWHWWTIVITILQIAVCAVLTYSIWFGFWLMMYVVMTIWTLAVFWMFMVETQFRQSESVETDQLSAAAGGGLVSQGGWSGGGSVKGGGGGGRSGGFTNLELEPSLVTNAIQLDSLESWVSPRFLLGMTAMSTSVVVFGLLVFLLIPRVWADIGIFGGEFTTAARAAMPGFTDRVQLNDVSANVDNPRTVFKVQMYEIDPKERLDIESHTPLSIMQYAAELGMAEPLFRGSVLEKYENGTWRPTVHEFENPEDTQHLTAWPITRENPTGVIKNDPAVLQVYELEPLETTTLFSLGAVRAARAMRLDQTRRRGGFRNVDVKYDIVTHDLRYESDDNPRGLRYLILSPRSPGMESLPHRIQPAIPPVLASMEIPANLEKLTAKSWEVVGREPDPERQSFNPIGRNRFRLSVEETRLRADRLANYLGNNPEYVYRLGAEIVDPTLDPVEDFVLNRKAGHCEYFASALALMLRSANIPSRVVTGFKGGISNKDDLSLVVLQRHAHAWVEAYIGDRWVTYDPTPAAEGAVQQEDQISLWEATERFISDTWSNYVVNLRVEDQRSVATPLWEYARDKFDRGTAAAQVRWVLEVASTPRLWFTWRGGILLLIIGGILLLIRFAYFLVRRIKNGFLATLKRAEIDRNSGVEFYEKFLSIMASRGLRPFPWQTQQEFATVSLEQLPVPGERRRSLAELIANLFYQVRFGGKSLNPSVQNDVQTQLENLEKDLQAPETSTPEKVVN